MRTRCRRAWCCVVAAACALTITCSVAAAGALTKYCVVKVSGLDGSISYEMLTSDEARALDKEIDRDARLHLTALRKATKAWKEDEDTGKSIFPRGAVSPRRLALQGTFRTEKEASVKLDRYMEQQSKKHDAAMEKARNRRSSSQHDSDSKAARKLQREEEAEQRLVKARGMYEAALAELKAAAEK